MFPLSRPIRAMLAPSLAIALLAASSPVARAQAAKLKWGPAPPALPHGAKVAVVSGDPGKTGPFTLQLSVPSGYRIAPHWHPTDEHLVVKEGTFLVGMGDKMDANTMKSMTVLKVGQSGDAKANQHHFAAARGHTVVEVSGTGPFVVNYVNPADDPRQATAAKGKAKAKPKAKA
jgi:mannose-6-phosphate isomerase-like protein (cupin superfamily)